MAKKPVAAAPANLLEDPGYIEHCLLMADLGFRISANRAVQEQREKAAKPAAPLEPVSIAGWVGQAYDVEPYRIAASGAAEDGVRPPIQAKKLPLFSSTIRHFSARNPFQNRR